MNHHPPTHAAITQMIRLPTHEDKNVKMRHLTRFNFCPSCHQRRTRTIGDWIATGVCHEVPHRQFVFTIPKVLRGIFRKRRHLLTHLFHTATILRFRACLS